MVGIGCPSTPYLLAPFQIILLNDIIEAVVAHAVLRAELTLVHLPEFPTADTAILLADTMDELYYKGLVC